MAGAARLSALLVADCRHALLGTPDAPGTISARFIADDARNVVMRSDEQFDFINVGLESSLQDAYPRNAIATVEAALGQCAAHVVEPLKPISNVVLTCRPRGDASPAPRLYTDDRNAVDWDRHVDRQ